MKTFSHPWASLYRDGRVYNPHAFAGRALAPHVGETPGDEWSQGGSGWEQGGQPVTPTGGPTASQIAALQQSVSDLKNQVDGVVAYLDPSTDPVAVKNITTLKANVDALSSSVASLAAGTSSAFVNYPVLLIKYNAYKNEFDGYGIELVTDPGSPANPSQGKPAATPPATTPVKPPATPDSPVVKVSPEPAPSNALPWGLLGGALLFALGALYFARKAL